MIGPRNYNSSEVGIGTSIVNVLKDYGNQKLDEDFVSRRIGIFKKEAEFYFSELNKIGIVERNNGHIWLKPLDISKNLNPASA